MYRMIQRNVTLIEMMIVMFLIAMIIGVVAYNYQGTLEEGKAFKTKAGKEKLETILTLALSDNPNLKDELSTNWKNLVTASPLVHNAKDLIRDGWGDEYDVKVVDERIQVSSKNFAKYSGNNRAGMFRGEEAK